MDGRIGRRRVRRHAARRPRRARPRRPVPALFLALLIGQLDGSSAVAAAALGALIAAGCLPWAPAGVPIVAAALAGLLGATPVRA